MTDDTSNVNNRGSAGYVQPLTGWASFVAVVNIVGGALYSLTILGALIGVPIIIGGVHLYKAVKIFRDLKDLSDTAKYNDAMQKVNVYFMINGMLLVLCIVGFIIYVIIFIALIATGAFSKLKNLPI
ncbi:MAG TPA: DUF5362 family protein [Spirochaetota bacterium]